VRGFGATALLLVLSCSGRIWEPAPAPTPAGDALPRRIALLTNAELAASIQTLAALAQPPPVTIVASSARGLLGPEWIQVTAPAAYQYWETAHLAAIAARQSRPVLFDCPAGDEAACAPTTIEAFASRAFRRPLIEDELGDLLQVYQSERDAGGTYADGIEAVVEAVLQAPSFLYRTELGQPDADVYRLTAFELAGFVSYFLTGNLPDDALWQAASAGALSTEAELQQQVERVLRTPAAQTHLTSVLMRWLRADDVVLVEKASPDFTPALAQSMREETERFLHDTLWNGDGTLAAMLTSERLRVDPRLAAHYQVDYPAGATGWISVEAPRDQRAGLLTQGSLMSRLSGVSDSSVVRRGLFVARDLLCLKISPPGAGVVEAAAGALAALPDERARSDYRRQTRPCSACHTTLDPYGLIFEPYDELGRHRDQLNGAAIDASWNFEAGSTPGRIVGARELATRLSTTPEVQACVARHLAEHALGHELNLDDTSALDAITAQFAQSAGGWPGLLRDLASWPAVRTRRGALQ
jgi:hypothetical protein